MKLDNSQKHLLRLIEKGKKQDGWTPVSEVLCGTVKKMVPTELVEFEKLETGGRIRFSSEGKHVYEAFKWL